MVKQFPLIQHVQLDITLIGYQGMLHYTKEYSFTALLKWFLSRPLLDYIQKELVKRFLGGMSGSTETLHVLEAT